jgi:quercetin dioxygenase-like cupin family protein
LRYFEIAPGGHSTLERHEHLHVVMILRGPGQALIENSVHALSPYDYVKIGRRTWHQFRATGDGPFGFLCLVNRDRDRAERPDADALARLRLDPVIAAFIKT